MTSRWSNWSTGSEQSKLSFSSFFSEAQQQPGGNPTGPGSQETPAQKAERLGLVPDGHGSYMDPQTDEIVARTVNGELVFYDGGQGGGATSDGEGGGDQAVQSGTQSGLNGGSGSPTFRNPDTGMVTPVPATPDSPEARSAVPDPTPATPPANFDKFIKREAEIQSAAQRMAAAQDAAMDDLLGKIRDEGPDPEAESPTDKEDDNPEVNGISLDDFLKDIQKEPKAPAQTKKAAKAAAKAIDKPTKANVAKADKEVGKAARRDSGNQFTELVVGAYLADPNVQSVQDVIDSPLPHENIARRDSFLGDLDNPRNSDKFIGQYIDGLRNAIGEKFGKIDPNSVYVRANNNDLAPEEIREQIKELAGGEHKADVMFTGEDGKHYGIGVKQDHKATLTNYSIESLFESAFNTMHQERNNPNSADYDPTLDSSSDEFNPDDDRLKSWGTRLREAREELYAEAGLPTTMAKLKQEYPEARKKNGRDFDWRHESVPSDLRDKYGEVMVPDDNIYHSTFRDLMKENGEDFMKFVYKKMFPANLPYTLYNFDGENLEEFTKEGLIGKGDIEVVPTTNPAKNPRGAAKQFFTMMVDGKPKFQMESRHKGDPFSSQQLFTHRWDEGKHVHRPYED